jgi:hypothetical protein
LGSPGRSGVLNFEFDLTSPVILSARYSACTEPEGEEPCSDNPSNRRSIPGAPHLIGHGWHYVSSACNNPDNATFSSIPVRDINQYAGTCLKSIASPRNKVALESIDGSDTLTDLISDTVGEEVCEYTAGDMLYKSGRGVPVMGNWSLVSNGERADIIKDELIAEGTMAPPGADWQNEISNVSGIEVLLFVGTEVNNEGQAPSYIYQGMVPGSAEIQAQQHGFETPALWSAPTATVDSTSNATQGEAALRSGFGAAATSR